MKGGLPGESREANEKAHERDGYVSAHRPMSVEEAKARILELAHEPREPVVAPLLMNAAKLALDVFMDHRAKRREKKNKG